MLDVKRIRKNYEEVKERVEFRGKGDFGLSELKDIDEKRREILAEVEKMKNKQNTVSRQIPKLKKEGKDTSIIMSEMKKLSSNIKTLDAKLDEIDEQYRIMLLSVPNTPNQKVPYGVDDSDNEVMRIVGEPTKFEFEAKAHWDIGEELDILDFERAAKISGTRFTVYKGLGARLERAYSFANSLNFSIEF